MFSVAVECAWRKPLPRASRKIAEVWLRDTTVTVNVLSSDDTAAAHDLILAVLHEVSCRPSSHSTAEVPIK